MKMEQTECSETSAYKIQTPGNYPEENIQHTEHGGYSLVLFCFLRRSISWDTISSNLARMIGTVLLPADLNPALIDISDLAPSVRLNLVSARGLISFEISFLLGYKRGICWDF
jgi:hypothetical protein